MADDTPPRLVLIVAGSSLRAEELDRPLAYYLKQQVERASLKLDVELKSLVIADFRWMNDEPLQVWPTISVGGPGVNMLAHHWFEEVPFSLAVDGQYCIQMDPDLAEPRASIWGMDNPATQIAVSVFVERFLPRFLDHAATFTPESTDPVDPDDGDD
jgi:hypothetical protein